MVLLQVLEGVQYFPRDWTGWHRKTPGPATLHQRPPVTLEIRHRLWTTCFLGWGWGWGPCLSSDSQRVPVLTSAYSHWSESKPRVLQRDEGRGHGRPSAGGSAGLPRYHTLSSHLLLPSAYTCPRIYRHPMPVLPVTHLELIHPRAIGLGLREAGMWPI